MLDSRLCVFKNERRSAAFLSDPVKAEGARFNNGSFLLGSMCSHTGALRAMARLIERSPNPARHKEKNKLFRLNRLMVLRIVQYRPGFILPVALAGRLFVKSGTEGIWSLQ